MPDSEASIPKKSGLGNPVQQPLENIGGGGAIDDLAAPPARDVRLDHLALDGSEGPRVQGVRQFANNLLAELDLPLAFWDERMSTAAVERQMIEADISRRRRSEIVDSAAAAYILQGLLDRIAQT